MTQTMLQRTKAFFARLFSPSQRAAHRQRQAIRRRKAFLEGLESRSLLATFHVSLAGSDSNSGITIADPFRTIQAAITAASASSDGQDIINVAGGVYNTVGVDQRF